MRTSRTAAALAAVLACVTAAAGCSASHPRARGRSVPAAALTASQVTTLRSYGSGDTVFGLNVLTALCRARPGANVVISPVSLAAGLGMAYLGARGATATAMAQVLHVPAPGAGLVAGLRARRSLLASLDRPGITFAATDRIWADPSLPTRPGYVAALRAGYQAGLAHAPLLSHPDAARRRINAAIAEQTRGHIARLMPPGSIPPGTIGWVLTDALYLNAAWKHRFDPAKTAPGPFRTAAGTVTARYMHAGGFAVAGAPGGWLAAALPYRGGRLAMLAILPPAAAHGAAGHAPGGGIAGCQVPGAATLRSLAKRLGTSGGDHAIALPKVSLTSAESLRAVLTRLGMGAAFGQGADFTGISPRACCLGFVRHAATLSVDEHGAVASAATAVGVVASALAMPVSFDRPYLLLIRDALTGEPLMMAWVANPAAG